MPKKIDAYETELLAAYEKGALKSVATKVELARIEAEAAQRAVAIGMEMAALRGGVARLTGGSG